MSTWPPPAHHLPDHRGVRDLGDLRAGRRDASIPAPGEPALAPARRGGL